MKAGILTINGLNNYGNRLQNYAVTSTLNKLGVECETLVPLQWSKTGYRQKLEAEVKALMEEDLALAQEKYPLVVRQIYYERFNEEYVPERFFDCVEFDGKTAAQYDYFVTGSDQVWNPQFRDSLGQLKNRLLAFAKPSQRVCFAPSIGIDEIEEKWNKVFHDELIKFPYLNVREQTGAEIIKELTGREAKVVLDPTFMIDKKEWKSLAKPLEGFDDSKPFILYYFLGEEKEEISSKMRELLDKVVKEKDMAQYRLLDKEEQVVRTAGPSQFLWLMDKASLICTDSFHGTVFSILMDKPFLLCDRKLVIADKEVDMSNRTISLLKKLNLENKLPANEDLSEDNLWKTDYDNAYRIIKEEQNMMNEMLKKAMRLS